MIYNKFAMLRWRPAANSPGYPGSLASECGEYFIRVMPIVPSGPEDTLDALYAPYRKESWGKSQIAPLSISLDAARNACERNARASCMFARNASALPQLTDDEQALIDLQAKYHHLSTLLYLARRRLQELAPANPGARSTLNSMDKLQRLFDNPRTAIERTEP